MAFPLPRGAKVPLCPVSRQIPQLGDSWLSCKRSGSQTLPPQLNILKADQIDVQLLSTCLGKKKPTTIIIIINAWLATFCKKNPIPESLGAGNEHIMKQVMDAIR